MAGTLEENGGSRCIRKQLPACFGDWDGEFGASRRCDAQPLSSQQESALKVLGTDGLFLFSSLDTDQDMYISPEEFKPIAEKLTGTREAGKPKRTWALTHTHTPNSPLSGWWVYELPWPQAHFSGDSSIPPATSQPHPQLEAFERSAAFTPVTGLGLWDAVPLAVFWAMKTQADSPACQARRQRAGLDLTIRSQGPALAPRVKDAEASCNGQYADSHKRRSHRCCHCSMGCRVPSCCQSVLASCSC